MIQNQSIGTSYKCLLPSGNHFQIISNTCFHSHSFWLFKCWKVERITYSLLYVPFQETDQQKIFEGECFPSVEELKLIFMDLDDAKYPHAWRGAVLLFGLGLALMVITDLFALLTACCRSCICCSVFTICGSLQTFAGIFFALGLLAYPAGWGSQTVKNACADGSEPFVLGANCDIGVAFWIAVAGTVCTLLASSLAIFAYQSTRSSK